MTNKKALTLEDINEISTLKVECVEVPEWNGVLYIRVMDGVERSLYDEEWSNSLLTEKTTNEDGEEEEDVIGIRSDRLRYLLLSLSVCNEAGETFFAAEKEALEGGITFWQKKEGYITNGLGQAALGINKLRVSDQESLGKPSDGTPTSDSGSSSQDTSENQSKSVNKK